MNGCNTTVTVSQAVMGVDPGVRGGVSVLSRHGDPTFCEGLRPDMTESELVALLKSAAKDLDLQGGDVCYFEKVGTMPHDGRMGAFTFGRITGFLRGALTMAGVSIKSVAPGMWQSALGCLTGGNKNITKTKAQELFPSVKVTHATADSLLIAAYGQRKESL